ncbi:hypothetical protein [Paenibacillus qinlingensis]|uniref:Uncharacterized protein n=1 Tax=Paenibacillus qinlingensis TaxID=1837343 RepID=A0ABU1NQ40_9BACL|nr:hypothetical protein [Paenibacillus qinlingensis]MDR6549596.1 hypothetical protein [Paenibacillus qinlingensis]
MAIYTPQGLKINLDDSTSFGLMARLYPEVKPDSILKTTESISVMTSSLGFFTGILCFVLRLSPSNIGICTLFSMIIGILLTNKGIVWFPFIQLGALFSHIYGIFLPTIIATAIGLILTGWAGVLSYLLTRFVASGIALIVGMGFAQHAAFKHGHAISTAERNFFNAYRYHAFQLGKSMSLELSYQELQETFWRETHTDYIQNDQKKQLRLRS